MFSNISRGMFRRPAKDVGTAAGSRPDAAAPVIGYHAAGPQLGTAAADYGDASRLPEGDGEADEPGLRDGRRRQSQQARGPRIVSIGGGKGGIGKSFLSANLAISLTRAGYRVALVDLDFGAANLHTCLGVGAPKISLFDFVNSHVESLEEVGVPTGVPGLTLYGGGQEFWQQMRPQSMQKIRLITKLQRLNTDYVILDLGAGTHVNTLDFFIFSHGGILVVVPEPTSIENAYVFLKSVLFRKLQSIVKAVRSEQSTEELLASLGNPKITTPPFSQLQAFAAKNPEVGQKILELMQMTQLGILMNQVRTQGDRDLGTSMTQICQQYFGFNAEFLGSVDHDDAVWKSVRNRRPLVMDQPDGPIAADLASIAKALSEGFLPPFAETARLDHAE